MIVAFDVDDTLIIPAVATGFDRDIPNYDVIAIYRWFQAQGHTMVIWSGGGHDYAVMWADKLGLRADVVGAKGDIMIGEVDLAFDDSDIKLGKVNVKVKRINNKAIRYPDKVRSKSEQKRIAIQKGECGCGAKNCAIQSTCDCGATNCIRHGQNK